MLIKRFVICAGLLLAAAGGWLPAAEAAGSGWMLVLSWSPSYCDEHPGSTEPQCVQANYFVPQTLVPMPATPDAGCAATQALPETQLSRLAMITLNRREVRTQWAMHGGCIPPPLSEYPVQLEYAARKIAIPDDYRQLEKRQKTTAAEIREKFMQANPGLGEAGFELQCRGGELSALRVCFGADMNFRDCPQQPAPSCKDKVQLRGARLSRFRS